MTSMPTMSPPSRVVVGVDTHKHVHAAAVLDERGALLGTATFDLAIPGISPTSTISGVQIEFGTGPVTEDANLLTSVPEPSSAILLSGLAGLVLVGRRFCR